MSAHVVPKKQGTSKTPPKLEPSSLLWGVLTDFTEDALKFVLDVRDTGDFVTGRFGPYFMHILSHPDYVRQVLVTDARLFDKPTITKRVLSDSAGKGLFTNDGESWKRQRKLVQPAFHTQRIAAYADVMVEYTNRLADRWQAGETIDMDHSMTELTMEIVGKTLFDVDISQDAQELGEVITTIFEKVNVRFDNIFVLPRWFPTKQNRAMKDALHRLDATIKHFIDEWRKMGEDKGDLLSMLLMAQGEDGEGMSDQQVHDEAVTLFVAGHETTANTLIWTWYLLSQHPEIEAKLHDELARVLGGRNPTFDDVNDLVYTEMIIKEAMRLYPPAWTITREANADTVIGDYEVKQGHGVMVNVFAMHRDARFFENPEQFKPERFSPENEQHIEKYAYIPFGGGPRVCVGNSFAMMEAKLVVATLAQRLRFDLAPHQVVEPERVFTLRAKYGMDMIVRERVSNPA